MTSRATLRRGVGYEMMSGSEDGVSPIPKERPFEVISMFGSLKSSLQQKYLQDCILDI